MSVEIRQVDPDDERAMRDYYDVYLAWYCPSTAAGVSAPPC